MFNNLFIWLVSCFYFSCFLFIENLALECQALELALHFIRHHPEYNDIVFLSNALGHQDMSSNIGTRNFHKYLQVLITEMDSQIQFIHWVAATQEMGDVIISLQSFKHFLSTLDPEYVSSTIIRLSEAAVWRLFSARSFMTEPNQVVLRFMNPSQPQEQSLRLPLDILPYTLPPKTIRKLKVCRCHGQKVLDIFYEPALNKQWCKVSRKRLSAEEVVPGLTYGDVKVFLESDIRFKKRSQQKVIQLCALKQVHLSTLNLALLQSQVNSINRLDLLVFSIMWIYVICFSSLPL